MPTFTMRRMARVIAPATLLLLNACATGPGPLYYWGEYQPQVYGHLTGEKGPDEQIASLEAGIEEAKAIGKPVAPGYLAHLGILYAEKQDGEKMLEYLDAEKKLYPESSAYIDFLMKSKAKPSN
ncbi:DUF4810 domain-containing protein [Thauera sp. CAU 1555]|uniref:DUF4810 domain-containing protein n=1 Tax=Thauera sedimentorum TaxID=2767595 RepID=A0ABR9BC94_9RHOO|nr:DUF4810 domain-containing protein [Thauera sedimentorum]MBC9073046.1 DUF4810 domain-containing protein [Thauera sedimentorum]MBD8503965.1 DUF4810 domain-containing protein [Thauera sedimentorum]